MNSRYDAYMCRKKERFVNQNLSESEKRDLYKLGLIVMQRIHSYANSDEFKNQRMLNKKSS